MTATTRIAFGHRAVKKVEDVTDLVAIILPGNRNQQHAAARILLVLKACDGLMPAFTEVERQYGLSRRTVERTRAKLACLGLIERVTWMNSRYGGQSGWRLSGRMSSSLRRLADWIEQWRYETSAERIRKERAIVELLRPAPRPLPWDVDLIDTSQLTFTTAQSSNALHAPGQDRPATSRGPCPRITSGMTVPGSQTSGDHEVHPR